jgi:hypothetical protein
MGNRPTTRYFLLVTACIAACLAITRGLIPNHPHYPSQSIALILLYTIAVAFVAHAVLVTTGSKFRAKILIGTLVTATFCLKLTFSRFIEWQFIYPDRVGTVLLLCPLCGAFAFYLVDAWFGMYRKTLFDSRLMTSDP